ALQDFLPLDLSLDVKTVRYDTLKVAKRLEAELGEDQASCIEGDPSEWELLPRPDGSFKVGIDGGYVRNWVDKKHNFEVIVGKSMLSFGEGEEDRTPSLKRFGFVQTLDTHPRRRLYEVLHSQDLQMNQEITFLSDGDDKLRALQWEMSPKATHILDCKYSSNPWPEVGGGTPYHHGAGIDRARRSNNSGDPFYSHRAGERCARPVWRSP